MRPPLRSRDITRTALVIAGIGFVAYGAFLVLTTVGTASIVGLGLWLAAAVIVHDGVFVPVVTVLGRILFGPRTAPEPDSAMTSESAEHARGHRILAARRRPPVRNALSDRTALFGHRALAVTRALLVAASLVSAVVVPEIWAQGRGAANPTILPGDYAGNLLVLWGVVAAASVIVLTIGLIAARRRR
ncbi:hypothetical protein [Brevibacterium oceani]|uniref:hypothetical protein n=1 Tax=Brevibacterium oceani TaxID=358099 RepID=UPI0015E74394|nr:hypothetical protein [Brevibacterium oceani]